MILLEWFDHLMAAFASFMWGTPLLVLLLGGGIYFSILSRLLPFRYLRHGVDLLLGKYNNQEAAGDLTHFQALSSALGSTVGLANIGGVAIAIQMGGPGALFWMWVCAFLGMSTKFFTSTLSVLYRGKDDQGIVQGGPMYFIEQGLGPKYKPLAVLFSVAGVFGCTVMFQSNQLTSIFIDQVYIPNGWFEGAMDTGKLVLGIVLAIVTFVVIIGGIKKIGQIAAVMVPIMVLLYLCAGLWVLLMHISEIPELFGLIIHDAFTGDAVMGGSVGALILVGVRRALFSTEAGLGTSDMAHGAVKTNEPIREGLVAMMEPFIDTIVICTITALVILASGVWQQGEVTGITLTAKAFAQELGVVGSWVFMIAVVTFGITTMISNAYYGGKCCSYLFGTKSIIYHRYFYLATIILGAIISIDVVINFTDGMYAVMAIPTMIASVLLAPKVIAEAKRYFANYRKPV